MLTIQESHISPPQNGKFTQLIKSHKVHKFDAILRLDNCKGNKAGYTATLVACGWAGAVLEVTRASGQEPYAQKAQKRLKSNSRKSVRWSAVPVAPM